MAISQSDETEVQFTKQPFIDDAGYRKIKNIHFSMFSGDEIRKASECQVWSGSYYDPSRKPIKEGLLDSRMGAANKITTCTTCHGALSECPGHFGYMTLALPVFHIGYLSAIINLLKSICKSCARILLQEKERRGYLRKMRNPRMGALEKSSLAKQILKKCKPTCHRCGYVNGMVKKEGTKLSIVHNRADMDVINKECVGALSHTKESKSVVSPVLNPVRVLALFKKMLDEDCEVLYLSDRPEKLIVTDISVPPLPIRPSILMDGGAMSNEDDLTSKLKSIMQVNAALRQDLQCTASRSKCLADWELLQIEVAQYINSDVRGVQQFPNMQPSKPTKGIIQRLKGKQGRFRGNLSGKRVEYTGRTVISPDPNLKITEVGVPILMAQKLTYPERVSQYNIEKLRQCVRNGPNKYPGANFLRYPDGNLMNLMYTARKRAADELKCGYIVDRHLEDGDIVLFNRQPSLHRMSIMSHRVRVMPWRTLRFNESVCNPYNADFDGDEMNMHVPQTEEARTEALTLMGVQNNLCTPKNGEILVASTQDFLTTSFLITRKDTFYDRAAFSQMCSYMGDAMEAVDLPSPAIIKPIELWTGKQVINVLVRPRAHMRVYLNLTMLEKNYTSGETMCPRDGYVYFRNSELISGQLGKATLGNGKKDGLFSVLLRDYNEHAAASCMNRLAKLSARWIGNHGFSIGIDDVQPGGELEFKKEQKITEGYKRCDHYIQLHNKGKLQLLPGCDSAQTLEVEITNVLNEIRETAANVCLKELHWRNSPKIMSECGSKGSPINISQMIACVGQQTVGGRRAPNGFINRTLPHVPMNSKTPGAKGFVANSFYSGLTPTEFFFHTMAGREGLTDTAVKTAETGYMSRRLVKALEDLSIQYDGTVRNASGGVVQFVYGDDGMDPAKMEGKSGAPLNLERLYMKIKTTCPPKANVALPSSEISKLVNARLSEHDATLTGGCSEKFKNDIREMIEKVIVSQRNTRRLLDIDDHINKDDTSLSLERLATFISGITLPQLRSFLDTCITRCRQKKVEAGSAVGVIGAQSIGEPGTQMTLKTFHFAGVASMNITRGVPRIKEIINAAKKISAPIITAALHCNNDARSAGIVKGSIEKTTLGQVAKSIRVKMTSRYANVIVSLDMESIQASQMSISAESVKRCILLHPKIKLKDQKVTILDGRKIVITLAADRKKLLFDLHTLKGILPDVVVQGISNVGRTVVNKDKHGKHNLHIEGTNLRAVMGTSGVNANGTTSNHVIEVERTLGIEAARNCIIREIHQTMADYGMSIDMRHMMLLADIMTYKGEVLGIQRYDIQKMKESVLMLASFEKTGDHLFNASFNGRQDNIEGVSECIIMGIPMPIGTGILKVRQRVTDGPDLCKGLEPILC